METQSTEHKLLDPEFEHTPVPQEYRKGIPSVAAVWFGFPMVLSSAVIGGVITAMLGFKVGIVAMIVGNLLLALMVGVLSYQGGRTGVNFALTAQRTFGRQGYYVVSGLLSTVVIGWFALMIGLTGTTMHDSFGANLLWMTIIGGVLYVATTFIGIKGLSFLGWIATPFYLLIGILAIVLALKSGNTHILSYQSTAGAGAISFGAAVTMVFAQFADSGTMTADFTRWAKNGPSGLIAALFAFPLGNFLAELVGAIVVASGVIPNATSNGGDIMRVLAGHNGFLTALSILFVFINLGTVSAHCLYNGAMGWSHMVKRRMRMLTIVLGIIGIIAAVSGIWGAFLNWLNLLGVIIPPIGTIIIFDQLILRRAFDSERVTNWRPLTFISWALASGIALVVNFFAPQLCVAVSGIIAAAIFFTIGSLLNKGHASAGNQEPTAAAK